MSIAKCQKLQNFEFGARGRRLNGNRLVFISFFKKIDNRQSSIEKLKLHPEKKCWKIEIGSIA